MINIYIILLKNCKLLVKCNKRKFPKITIRRRKYHNWNNEKIFFHFENEKEIHFSKLRQLSKDLIDVLDLISLIYDYKLSKINDLLFKI